MGTIALPGGDRVNTITAMDRKKCRLAAGSR